jgi:hypothetical protein
VPGEFAISILPGKFSLDGSSLIVAIALPGDHFVAKGLAIGESPIRALATQDADLDLSHVEPTGVLGLVMELGAAQ